MWTFISKTILRNRITLLVLLGIATAFMAYETRLVRLHYGLAELLPADDSTSIAFEQFKARYGGEGSVYVIGIEENPLRDLDLFNAWYRLSNKLENIHGVDTVVSVARIFSLEKNSEQKKFIVKPVVTSELQTEAELDSIRELILNLPFYNGLLYNDSTHATLMAINMDSKVFDSKERIPLIAKVMEVVKAFSQEQNITVHYSGLPFIRTVITQMVKQEMQIFIILSILVTIVVLFLFFRSYKPVVVSMLVVGLGVVCTLGTMGLLGYEITILTAIIPSLIIVIGVPNCIFLINKYHHEFKYHGNQAKALTRVIQKVGNATFLTNATTAIGFITFIFTQSQSLKEFGVVAAINIMAIFFISLLIIPIIFSFLSPPEEKHTRHLDNKLVNRTVGILVNWVLNHRKWVYITTIVLVIFGGYGVYHVQTTGNIVDDLPDNHQVITDLSFFEQHFNGIMPFEVSIDAKKPGRATTASTLKRIDKLQRLLEEYPEFSRAISIAEGIKFIKQSFYNGNPKKYSLIENPERAFFQPYLKNEHRNRDFLQPFIDSTKQYTRVRLHMADVGTERMDTIISELKFRIDSIFPPEKYTVDLTGASVVFLAGTNYLVKNLFISLGIAILLIAFMMALLFSSLRMVIVSLFTNLIPLGLAAAMMGYFDIGLRPSTILVFSIAFGISIDDTIHFLAKYRQELKTNNWNIRPSVIAALKETGVSMIYTSIILFFGFAVFITSDFGGTFAMGLLASFTLLIAMLANLVLLPSFLMSLDKAITTKSFNEPFFEILDEEEDIELEELKIREVETGYSHNSKNQSFEGNGSPESIKKEES